jgi:hypothetical protein
LQFIHYLVPTQIVISGTSSITLSASTDSSSQSYSLVLPKLKGTPYLKLENNDTGQMIMGLAMLQVLGLQMILNLVMLIL